VSNGFQLRPPSNVMSEPVGPTAIKVAGAKLTQSTPDR
jgi:hypothetical protein